MELIQALEQLSLEVKNSHLTKSVCTLDSDDQSLLNQQVTNLNKVMQTSQTYSTQSKQNQSNTSTQYCQSNAHNQLKEFDNSVHTLFEQIADLELSSTPDISESIRLIRNFSPKDASGFREPIAKANSIDTEEDSDCSSQQSDKSRNHQRAFITNPFVKDLLKRDLNAITDTVRKIGKILAIGNEIENITSTLPSLGNAISNCQNQFINSTSSSGASDDQQSFVIYAKSLCQTFDNLCSGEPHLWNLPTIIHYKNLSQSLSNKIDDKQLTTLQSCTNQQHPNPLITTASLNSTRCQDVCMESSGNSSNVVEYDVEDVSETFTNDIEICDERYLDKWTENKLYVDQGSG